MSLNGIDVSSWDPGIDVTEVPCDFVIVKATGGTRYDNPEFERVARDALAAGKLLGIYHFAGDGSDGTPEEEARHFLDAFAPYKGQAIPVLDWEADAVDWPVSWAREWMEIVERETGANPWFYSYASYLGTHDCSEIARFPLWVAAYYAGYRTMGYQEDPPFYGSLGSWESAWAYQYTSSGVLPGWDGRLDLSIFYGDRYDWMSMAAGQSGGSDDEASENNRKEEEALRPVSIPNDGGEVYRLYDENNGDHMFTANPAEKDHLIEAGWTFEGAGWKFPPTPNIVYRMYLPNNGDHLFTTSFEEAQNAQDNGYRYEGANFSASKEDGEPVYRLYNENDGSHMYTVSASEKSYLLEKGWKDEGIAFYAAK